MGKRIGFVVVLVVLLVLIMAVSDPYISTDVKRSIDRERVTELSVCEGEVLAMSTIALPYEGPTANPNLLRVVAGPQYDPETHTNAWNYRTRINQAVREGVNYAGEYVVAEWGIGTGTQGHAIVSARTGEVLNYGLKSQMGVSHISTSTLLVVNPKENFMELEDRNAAKEFAAGLTREYYIIQDGEFVKVCEESADNGW